MMMPSAATEQSALCFALQFPKPSFRSSFVPTCRQLQRVAVSSSSSASHAPRPPKHEDRTVVLSAGHKPQRVAIAGAGIAGLSTALALVRTAGIPASAVDIYEPRETLDLHQGAAVNLNGGCAVLKREYGVSLSDVGIPLRRVVSRSVTGRLLFDVDVEKAFRAYGSRYLIDDDGDGDDFADGALLAKTVMRDDLQIALADAVEAAGVTIHRGAACAVRSLQIRDGRPHIVMGDGSVKSGYDLVVGGDGIRSKVRTAIAGPEAKAQYTGFRVQWVICKAGVTPTASLPRGELHQWFGDGGYALHYAAGKPGQVTEMFALSHRNADAVDENVGYRSAEALRERVAHRMEVCRMPPAMWDVFEKAERFMEVGVYSHEVTRQWSRDGVCVLVGDAAHAMAPYLGQGANQAIQDAHALALTLRRVGKDLDSVGEALQEYEAIRRAPTEALVKSSGAVGWLETQQGFLGTRFRDNLLTFAGRVHGIHRGFAAACTPRFE